MRRLSKSKKALFFNIAIAFITLGILTYALIALSDADKLKNVDGETRHIGSSHLQLVQGYQQGENAFIYLDLAAKHSANKVLKNLDKKGLVIGESKCGRHLGYSLWTTDQGDCFPNIVSDDFTSKMDTELDKFLDKYEDVTFPDNNYRYTINPLESGKSLVVGEAREVVSIPLVYRKGEVLYTENAATEVVTLTGAPTIGSPSATALSDQDCHYCNRARQFIKELYGDAEYQECIRKTGKKGCCLAKCPPGTKFITVIPPYMSQCSPLGKGPISCWRGRSSSCGNACNTASAWMALKSGGREVDFRKMYCPGGGEYQIYTGKGSYHIGMKRVAKKEGFVNTAVEGGGNFEKIRDEVWKGNPVPFVITHPKLNPSNAERCSWTTGGHYIIAIGASENALIINDPYVSRGCSKRRNTVGEHQVWSKDFVQKKLKIHRRVNFRR